MTSGSPSRDDAARILKEVNNMRFRWHERIIADLQLSRAAIAFGGFIMHSFHVTKGYTMK